MEVVNSEEIGIGRLMIQNIVHILDSEKTTLITVNQPQECLLHNFIVKSVK